MNTCPTKKICFISKEAAEEEIISNRIKYNYPPGSGPVNVYKCEICENYHFTSKGEPSPVLKKNKNKIDSETEANYWKDKLNLK